MRRVTRLAATALIVLVASLACTGDDSDSSTLDEYFTQLERIGKELNDRQLAVGTPNVGADASIQTQEQVANTYDLYATIVEDAVTALSDLDPPDEVASEHARLVAALGELPSATYIYANRVRDATTDVEFQQAIAGTAERDAISRRVAEACSSLQAVADANEIAADVRCQ